MTLLYVISLLALLWSVFERLVLVDPASARLSVRVAFVALGSAALAGLYWAIFRGYAPDWPDLLLAVATAAVQWLSARHLWHGAVPGDYRPTDAVSSRPAADSAPP